MLATEVKALQELVPAPQSLWQTCCARCSLPRAHWLVKGRRPAISLCSLCVLYGPGWGADNASEVTSVLELVQRSRGQAFAIDAGRLQDCADADRILGVLVLTDRLLMRVPR